MFQQGWFSHFSGISSPLLPLGSKEKVSFCSLTHVLCSFLAGQVFCDGPSLFIYSLDFFFSFFRSNNLASRRYLLHIGCSRRLCVMVSASLPCLQVLIFHPQTLILCRKVFVVFLFFHISIFNVSLCVEFLQK